MNSNQIPEESHLSPTNKYVYSAYAPVGWLARNDTSVPYREFEMSQDGKTVVANVVSAFAMGMLAKLAASHSHHSPNLSTSAAILDHTANLNLRDMPGKGYSSTQPNYEFNETLPIQNIARLEAISTDENSAKGFDSEILRGVNKQLNEGSERIADKHWENLQNGVVMPTQLVYITTSQPPEYVLLHGIDNGLIFNSPDEAKKCAESNFPIPVVEKPLTVAQIFHPEAPAQQFDLTSTSDLMHKFKQLRVDDAIAKRTFEMEDMADINQRKIDASEAKEKAQNINPFIASPVPAKNEEKNSNIELAEPKDPPRNRRG